MTLGKLELLSPAKDRETGIAAIDHGADAVYIGAPRFSARRAASNSIRDIEELAAHAHLYNAKVYAAFNTLLFDQELGQARDLIHELWNAGVDALIIQDMGILEMDLPPIPLFASTQCDNQSLEKIRFLEASGFERVILARELGLLEIEQIRQNTRVDLEVFVHGALCVGLSGQCYLSGAMGGRSGNRGGCGQPCRLPWDLVSAKGEVLARQKHLLSLKDMNRSDCLGQLIDSGVTSFKIEGRLKDQAYVKNITAYYRKKLDGAMEGRNNFGRASSGKPRFFFKPDPQKTFFRGQTAFLLSGNDPEQKRGIFTFYTPKSTGERMGRVKRVETGHFTLNKAHDITPGDGLCFVDRQARLKGFYVNARDGERIIPAGRKNLKTLLHPGDRIFRNLDHNFLKLFDKPSSQRRIGLDLRFLETREGFELKARDEDGNGAVVKAILGKTPAKNRAMAKQTLEQQLSKFGDSIFELNDLTLDAGAWFLPKGKINALRRELIRQLIRVRKESYIRKEASPLEGTPPFTGEKLDFTANVSNRLAARFYEKAGVKKIEPAFEIQSSKSSFPSGGTVVLKSRHCIRLGLGFCPRLRKEKPPEKWQTPLFLENPKGRFEIVFHCKTCEMDLRTVSK